MAEKSPGPPISEEQMEAFPPEFRTLLQTVIDYYEARLTEQNKRIAELEERLNRTSGNSSKPPSSGHPHGKPAATSTTGRKRKRGGQPGHNKHQRDLVPVEEVDDLHTLKPSTCRGCGNALIGDDPVDVGEKTWRWAAEKRSARCQKRRTGELVSARPAKSLAESEFDLPVVTLERFRRP